MVYGFYVNQCYWCHMKIKLTTFSILLLSLGIQGCSTPSTPSSSSVKDPYLSSTSKFDEYKNEWTITSSRWGNNLKSDGPNRSMIRAFLHKNGNVTSQLYVWHVSKDKLHPLYALDKNNNQFVVTNVVADVRCSKYLPDCFWRQESVISIDWGTMGKIVGGNLFADVRMYSEYTPKDFKLLQ